MHCMPNSKLIVTVVPGDFLTEERQAWLAALQAGFAHAYAKDEPDYSNAVLRVDVTELRA